MTIAFVTVCRARLDFLKQTLPAMLAQPVLSVVLVDYSCPERCGDWAEATHPAVRVLRIPGQATLNIGAARNAGAALATASWIGFVDCDLVLDPSFVAVVGPMLEPGCFYRAHPESMGISGTWLVGAEDFRRSGGYDDVFRCYGDDDYDAFDAMRFAGLRERSYPAEMIYHLPHDHDLRTEQFAFTEHKRGVLINRIYRVIKWEWARQRGSALTKHERVELYDRVFQRVDGAFGAELSKGGFAMEQVLDLVEQVLTTVAGQPEQGARARWRQALLGR
jgi:glycosyltransferase involved in cell wall biosynthesis